MSGGNYAAQTRFSQAPADSGRVVGRVQVRFVQVCQNLLTAGFSRLGGVDNLPNQQRQLDSDGEARRARKPGLRWQHVAGAGNDQWHEWQAPPQGDGKSTVVKAAQPGFSPERAFREKNQRSAVRGSLHDPAGIVCTLPGVIAFNKVGTNAAQEEVRQRHPGHFTLDNELEAMRQYGGQQYAVHVAGVVRDDDGCLLGQVMQPGYIWPRAGQTKYQPGTLTDYQAPPILARNN